jgi:hypothetical protein
VAKRRPVCWSGLCFQHTGSDDLAHHYRAEGESARLVERRGDGWWLAELRGVTWAEGPQGPAWREDPHDVARRACAGALAELAKRR